MAMPLANSDLDSMWDFLKDGIEHVMMIKVMSGISYADYMSLYTVCYNFVCTPSPGVADGAGHHLYDHLIQYFVSHLETLCEVRLPCVGFELYF